MQIALRKTLFIATLGLIAYAITRLIGGDQSLAFFVACIFVLGYLTYPSH